MNGRLLPLSVTFSVSVQSGLPTAVTPFRSKRFTTIGRAGNTAEGLCQPRAAFSPTGVLTVDHQPMTCFGLVEDPGKVPLSTHMILLKSPPGDRGQPVKVGIREAQFKRGSRLDCENAIKLICSEQALWKYDDRLRAGRKTHLTASEPITAGKTETKPGEPRAFHLTVKTPTLKATMIALPSRAPGHDAGSGQGIKRTVSALANIDDESEEPYSSGYRFSFCHKVQLPIRCKG